MKDVEVVVMRHQNHPVFRSEEELFIIMRANKPLITGSRDFMPHCSEKRGDMHRKVFIEKETRHE